MATGNGVVLEALTSDNYEDWSILTKNYLISQDLWDDAIVDHKEEGVGKDAGWKKKKNAQALHIIQMSCGSEYLSKIRKSETAKSAWTTLESLFRSVSSGKADIEKGLTPLQRGVLRRDWESARCLMNRNRKAVYESSETGRTVLHVAVVAGDLETVKKLAKQTPKRLLEERDASGYTALALVADSTDDVDMARCMVDRSEALLGIPTNEELIPVDLAAIKRHKNMTRYLYNKTPRSILNNNRTSASLLVRCITSEIFDVALDLLRRNPQLPLDKKFDDVSPPIYALAQKPSVFPSASSLTFWQRWLYNLITHDEEGKAIKIRLSINQGDLGRHAISGVRHKLWGKILTLTPFKHLWKIILAFIGYLQKLCAFLFFYASWEKILKLGPIRCLWKTFLGFPVIKRIYEKKMTHFQVIEILRSMAKGILDFDDLKLRNALVYHSLLEASKSGIVEFINLMVEANPDLYWVIDGNHRGIFSHAVLHRQEKIFNLVYQLRQGSTIMSEVDVFGNNMLHFTGMWAAMSKLDHGSSPALQLQREIQWFEAVKRILHPKFQQATNGDGKKPQELFTEKHEKLVKDGVQWAKNTANTFTVVETLLITIMFAAAFTVPGGNNDDNGVPIFINERMFTVFMVADALSLFASTTSVMIFIVILTSRYAEKDFLKTLPKMLMFGVLALIFAVLTMMLAFCAAFSLMLRGHFQIVIVAISVASVSVIIFLVFQLPLLLEIFNSTYRSPILTKMYLA